MVRPLPSPSANATVLCVDSTVAVNLIHTFGTPDRLQSEWGFVSLVTSRTGRFQLWRSGSQASMYRTSSLLRLHIDLRSRVSSLHGVCMASENKEALIFDPGLARSSVDSHVQCSTTNPGAHAERDFEGSIQIGNEKEQGKKSKSQTTAMGLVFDSHKRQISLPGWRTRIWKNLRGGSRSLEVIPQVPSPPLTGSLIIFFGFVLIFGLVLEKWIGHASRGVQLSNVDSNAPVKPAEHPKPPTRLSSLERDLKKKESVEWVNMVLGKLWKVYRLGLESWLVGLFQPLIDSLQKPVYVERVQIKRFHLGDEPLSVRSVERKASRRANDLQYHIGLRYSGGARMVLLLKMKFGILPITIPVRVRGLDIDGELWVKLRLVPSEPWVGTATWAFVSLPKIKLDLSPFGLFNLMAIPFLSVFLTKLLTEDLPRLFVRPNKNVVDFLQGKAVGPVPKDYKRATLEGNKDFSGELSVTLVDARKLSYVPYGKTDPYVVLILGDQVARSKKNSQTSAIGPPGTPIWNQLSGIQDFQLLVIDPKTQHLTVQVRDYFGLTGFMVGSGKVELSELQDTSPADRVVALRGGWGPFQKRFAGELLLRLTYTAYVEDEDEDMKGSIPFSSSRGYTSYLDENSDALVSKVVHKAVQLVQGEESITDVFAVPIAQFNHESSGNSLVTPPVIKENDNNGTREGKATKSRNGEKKERPTLVLENIYPHTVKIEESERTNGGMILLWLGLVTGLAVLVDISLKFSGLPNP